MVGRRVHYQFLSAPADADRALFAALTEPSCLGLPVTLPRERAKERLAGGARFRFPPAAALC